VLLIRCNTYKSFTKKSKTFLLIFLLFDFNKQFNEEVEHCEHYCCDDVFAGWYVSHSV
jgi:hypothetical protein